MFKLVSSVMISAIFSGLIFCSANAAETQKKQEMTPPKPLENTVYDSMVGTWIGESEMMGAKVHETLNIKWDLNHQFISMVLRAQGVDKPDNIYEGMGLFGADQKGNAKCWWFDSWGANAVAMGQGKFTGNTLTIADSNKMFSETRSFTVNGNQMVMIAKGTMMMNGKKMPFEQKVVYTKS